MTTEWFDPTRTWDLATCDKSFWALTTGHICIKISGKIYKDSDILISLSDGAHSLTHPRHDDKQAGREVVVDDEGQVLPAQRDLHSDGREGLSVAAKTVKGYDLEEDESNVFYCIGYVCDLVKNWLFKTAQSFLYTLKDVSWPFSHRRALNISHVYKRREEDFALVCLLTMCILSSSYLSVSKNFCAQGIWKHLKQICYFPFFAPYRALSSINGKFSYFSKNLGLNISFSL